MRPATIDSTRSGIHGLEKFYAQSVRDHPSRRMGRDSFVFAERINSRRHATAFRAAVPAQSSTSQIRTIVPRPSETSGPLKGRR